MNWTWTESNHHRSWGQNDLIQFKFLSPDLFEYYGKNFYLKEERWFNAVIPKVVVPPSLGAIRKKWAPVHGSGTSEP